MKTDYKKINYFEMAIIAWAFVGLALIGFITFRTLPTESRLNITYSMSIFDIHEQAREAIDLTKFILTIPNEFHEQFYLAFTQIAVLPEEHITFSKQVFNELNRNAAAIFEQVAHQIATNYEKETQQQQAQAIQTIYDGKVLGIMVEVSDKFIEKSQAVLNTSSVKKESSTLVIPYHYEPPKIEFLNMHISKFINY